MIRSVAFVGMGAVGAIYAELAIQCKEVSCFAIVRDRISYEKQPVTINNRKLNIPLKTSDEGDIVDLVIIAVKWHSLKEVMEQIAPFIGKNTKILSLLNGINSEQIIASRFPHAHVLLSMCSAVDSKREGRAVYMSRRGKIVFGEKNSMPSDAVRDIAQYFECTGIPYEIPRDMLHQMWWKLMVNVGMNQVSAVTNLDYGEIRTNKKAKELMHEAQREVIAVANAHGISMNEYDIEIWNRQLEELSSHGYSSTLQDIRARRKTEVELYGEEICRLGKLYGIKTPVNERLVRKIRDLEEKYL